MRSLIGFSSKVWWTAANKRNLENGKVKYTESCKNLVWRPKSAILEKVIHRVMQEL
jgi:hypothetical protein